MRLVGLLALLGCPAAPVDTDVPTPVDTDPPVDTDLPPTPPVDTGLPPGCPALVLTVDPPGVPANRPAQFRATGGSGEVTWSFVENRSGGLVDPLTGTYLAGPLTGVVDEVRATDADCALSAQGEVAVLDALVVLPTGGNVPRNVTFPLEILGGSNQVACALTSSLSGGSLAGCTYTAGPTDGLDVLTVTDALTGEVVEIQLQVTDTTGFGAAARRFVLPAGHELLPGSVGGTGTLDVTVLSGSVTVAGDALVGVSAGRSVVELRDRFTQEAVEVDVDVVEPLTVAHPRDGERGTFGEVVAADIDGDGFQDAVVASLESSVGAFYSGAVVVYAGTATGLDPDPVQVFTTDASVALYGRDVTLGDFDGDGVLDLATGADADDTAGGDAGRVYVHRGVPGAFFEPEPRVLDGLFGGDRHGHSVEACDVDGDGLDDLLVGALSAEDRSLTTQAANQGGVHVYLGTPFGLPSLPDASIWGQLHDGTSFQGAPGLGLGRRMTTGDWNGDGLCDVFAGSEVFSVDGGGQDGLVAVWLGGPTGFEAAPARVFAHTDAVDASVQFGYALAAADLDGDGRDDLAVGAWAEQIGPGNSAGSARVFLAATHEGGPPDEVVGQEAADVLVIGDSAFDQLGFDVGFGDTTGDGTLDLLIGAPQDEALASVNTVGVVWSVDGTARGEVPLATATPIAVGAAPDGWFGAAFAPLGDADADGIVDLAVFAARDPAVGPDAGATWFAGATPALLTWPGEASGGDLGVDGALAWADLDGVGGLDLLAGAPEAGDLRVGSNAGRVLAFSAGAGAASEPWGDHELHSIADRFGGQVVGIGDFDGDGHDDVGVTARTDSRPAAWPTSFVDPTGCAGNLGNAGSLWIFRGGPSGLAVEPAFVTFGTAGSGWIEVVAGGFDRNGDDLADLAFGGARWNSLGGVRFVTGRAWGGVGTDVICDGLEVAGASNNSRLGSAVVGVADLDGDGCDEVAVGADADDLGRTNQGALRLFWGSGGPSCPGGLEVSTLVGGEVNARAGERLAAGDLDGDGLFDVAVGMPQAGGGAGRVAVARGAVLAGSPRMSVDTTLPADGVTVTSELPSVGWVRDGGSGSRLGTGLAVVDHPDGAWLAVGAPGGDLAGVPASGGVLVWEGLPTGLSAVPAVWMGGESAPTGSLLGAGLLAGSDGSIVVGAPRSDALVLDGGALYVLPP